MQVNGGGARTTGIHSRKGGRAFQRGSESVIGLVRGQEKRGAQSPGQRARGPQIAWGGHRARGHGRGNYTEEELSPLENWDWKNEPQNQGKKKNCLTAIQREKGGVVWKQSAHQNRAQI